jgi:hypothetical protein
MHLVIKDTCLKTPFLSNGKLFHQVDGVSMGSSLGPVLANIIMTELEKRVVDNLVQSGLVCFYARYVDDTLLLAKPKDFPYIKDSLNSFCPSLQFTYETFDTDVHFLDICIRGDSTSIFRKNTHTGQYVHYDSFEPWCTKIAWVRSLVFRAFRICSNIELFTSELDTIKRFLQWNGFPKYIATKLIKQFTP